MAGEQFCIDISTIDDSAGEGTEQFELYFQNLPSVSARDGDPNVLCVNILDNDGELIVVYAFCAICYSVGVSLSLPFLYVHLLLSLLPFPSSTELSFFVMYIPSIKSK